MVEAYIKMFKNYANFKDRTTRRDYWLALLCNILAGAFVGFIVGFFTGLLGFDEVLAGSIIACVSFVFFLALIIPSIAMVVRRLHDVNKSGWWYFIVLVPLIGGLWLLILECMPSVTESNNYGVQL